MMNFDEVGHSGSFGIAPRQLYELRIDLPAPALAAMFFGCGDDHAAIAAAEIVEGAVLGHHGHLDHFSDGFGWGRGINHVARPVLIPLLGVLQHPPGQSAEPKRQKPVNDESHAPSLRHASLLSITMPTVVFSPRAEVRFMKWASTFAIFGVSTTFARKPRQTSTERLWP